MKMSCGGVRSLPACSALRNDYKQEKIREGLRDGKFSYVLRCVHVRICFERSMNRNRPPTNWAWNWSDRAFLAANRKILFGIATSNILAFFLARRQEPATASKKEDPIVNMTNANNVAKVAVPVAAAAPAADTNKSKMSSATTRTTTRRAARASASATCCYLDS